MQRDKETREKFFQDQKLKKQQEEKVRQQVEKDKRRSAGCQNLNSFFKPKQ